jgi:hypothetical protein
MTTNTVNLAKFYALTFSVAQQKVTSIKWANVPGQNKLRKFFLRSNWQNDIAQVSCSRAGAKGGAFFLEVDSVDKEELGDTLGNWTLTLQVWDQLIADGLIDKQGIKTAAGKAGTLPQNRPAYNNNRPKITGLLKAVTPHPQFVVKGTEEPARILFAEYVLSLVAKAKIPKSLILEVDPARPANSANPSEGMLMLELLKDPAKLSPTADQRAYARSYAYLDDRLGNPQTSYVSYLVVQKLIAGRKLPIYNSVLGDAADFMVKHKLKITAASFFADPAFQRKNANGSWVVADSAVADLIADLQGTGCINQGGIVDANFAAQLPRLTKIPAGLDNDVARILQASLTILQNCRFRFTSVKEEQQWDELDQAMPNIPNTTQQLQDLKKEFDDLREKQGKQMWRLESIVSDKRKMKNAGRVMLADLPIGIADRFENMNMDNVFFVDKITKVPGKLSDPIGCIDNEAIMQEFIPERTYSPANSSIKIREGFVSLDKYVNALLAGSSELWGLPAPLPTGYELAPSPSVKNMLDIDRWFDTSFQHGIFAFMPECVVQQMSAKLYKPKDTDPYTASKSLETWQDAKKEVGKGAAEALLELQKIPLFKFRQVYTSLVAEYDRGANFNFTAFEARYKFLCAMAVKNGAIKPFDFKARKVDIVQYLTALGQTGGLVRTISQALGSAEATAILSGAGVTVDDIKERLCALSVYGQEAIVPYPFGKLSDNRHFGDLDEDERKVMNANWNGLADKYKKRIDAVICTIVAKFAAEYEVEANANPLTYLFVPDSKAYRDAKDLAREFSRAKLFEDGGSKSKIAFRQKLLTDNNLAAYI